MTKHKKQETYQERLGKKTTETKITVKERKQETCTINKWTRERKTHRLRDEDECGHGPGVIVVKVNRMKGYKLQYRGKLLHPAYVAHAQDRSNDIPHRDPIHRHHRAFIVTTDMLIQHHDECAGG